MLKNQKINIAILLVFIMTLLGGVSANAATLNDTDGHWAKNDIQKMIEKNAVTGYPDSTFKPDNTITRAEFMTIVNKAFSFNEETEILYKDVQSTDWFSPQVKRAQKAGYISGYEDNTMRPNNEISRQETALIVSRILNMETNSSIDVIKQFIDAASIPDWSKAAIGAVVKSGYMNGYPDKSFGPQNPITRAEAVVVISRCLAEGDTIFNQPGTYGPETGLKTINGDVAITVSEVTLQNTVINGDLTIASTVGEGDFTLRNVTVKGTTYVNGGGANSGTLDGFQGIIIVNKDGVRLIAAGGTTVDTITLNTFATLEESPTLAGGGFYNLVLNDSIPPGTTVIILGDFNNVSVNAPDITLQVESGSITDLEINQAADVTGKGSIKTATVNSAGVNIAQVPDKTVVAEGMTATVGGKEVEETYTKPPETPGGGGGGPSISSDATLASLTISAGTLAPAFQAGITEYTAKVGNSISSVTVTPTVSNNKATVTVAGKTVISGQASGAINLAVGENSLKVVVKAQDGTEKTYEITITRASDSIPDIVIQLQEIYEYIDDADKGYIQNARAEISNITSSDWDSILVNLLTNEVENRFSAVGKDAKTEMVAFAQGLGNIYYSKDAEQLEATLEGFKNDFQDSYQVLLGTENSLDDLYQLLVASREKLPEVIKSGYADDLAFGTDAQVVATIPEVMKDALRQAISADQFSKFKGQLSEIDWSIELLISERVKLTDRVDPANQAELALSKAVVRSESILAGVNNSETYPAQKGKIDLTTAMKSYELKLMGRNATGLVDWIIIATDGLFQMDGNGVIAHDIAVIKDNQNTLEITPQKTGEIELIAVRGATGASADNDWILSIMVNVVKP